MNKPILTAVLLTASAVSLGGCQGLFGGSHHARKDAGDAASRDPSAYAAIHLAAGRKALDYRQYAEAITAFRLARSDAGLSADAHNGLAIAYTNLGRQDLAVRYFNEAIKLAPTDDRFKANLARLYRTSVVPTGSDVLRTAIAQAEQQAAELDPSASSERSIASSSLKGAVSVAKPTAGIVRVSAREVRVQAHSSPGTAGTSSVASVAVRIEKPSQNRPNAYPIRVSLAPSGGKDAMAYPIRVRLSPAR